MDKLVSHGIRMLEIVEGENDFFRNDAKRQADIARAVYDTILRVQMLERNADRKIENLSEIPTSKCEPKTENCSEIPNNCEPQTDEEQFCIEHKCTYYRPKEGGCTKNNGDCPFDEPQTDCAWREPCGR